MDEELDRILDENDSEGLRVTMSHDGFTIYRITGETNRWDEPEDERLWSWHVEFDSAPFGALETLFAREGLEVEQL